MGGAYIGHVAMHAILEDRTHGEKRPGVPHPGITPMGASCHSVVFRRTQKQILRFLECDAPLRTGLGGRHRSPEIGLRFA